MNQQTLELCITLNRGKSLPKSLIEEIYDAIEERMEQYSAGDQCCTNSEKHRVGHIAITHKGKVVYEYCGV